MTRPSLIERPLRALLAPLERRIGTGKSARLYALADQGSSGFANVIAFALLGRALPVAQFGAVGIMIGLHYFLAGFHRSAVVLPFTTFVRADHGAEGHSAESGWWWLSLGLSALLTAAAALAGLAVAFAGQVRPSWAWLAEPLLLAALISPSMLAWEFARRWLYKDGRADLVGLCSACYFVLLVSAAWSCSRLSPSAAVAALAWVAASFAALLLALSSLRPGNLDRAIAVRLMRLHRTDAAWLAATNLPYSIYSSASVVVLIGLMVGPVAAALFSAARTLNNPAISITSAIDSLDKPHAARAFAAEGTAGLVRVVRRSRRAIVLATGLYLALVSLLATPLIRLTFEGRYAGMEREVRLLALGFFLFGMNLPSETMLIVRRASGTMLAIRCATAIVTVALLAAGAAHGVLGMAIAYVASQTFNLLLLCLAEARTATDE